MTSFPLDPDPLARTAGWLLAAVAVAMLLGHGLRLALARWDLYRAASDDAVRRARRAARALLVVLALRVVLPRMAVPVGARDAIAQSLVILAILSTAWFVVAGSRVVESLVAQRYRADVKDNLHARRIQTKVRLLRRVLVALVGFLAFAGILMTFDPVRRLGLSLFASAGVAGLVVGIAAQSTLSNLVAGVQVALTEPIRLDDVVIVKGEWGWVEEIGMTYVVVRIWDRRRLVVPLKWFIDHPFENWTRRTADILGTVFLSLDYRTPVEPLRNELRRIVEEEGGAWWDGDVCGLQVVDADERTITVRALVGSPTSPDAWELRCLVRERLVAWLQRHHPEALPRVRAELDPAQGDAA